MKKIYTLLVVGSLLAISSVAQAEPGRIGLGIKAGTLGGGLEVSMDVNPYLEIRAGINQVSFDFDAPCFLICILSAMLFALPWVPILIIMR